MARRTTSLIVIPLIGLAGAGPALAQRATSPLDLERARNFDLARNVAARAMPRGDSERDRKFAAAPRFTEDPLGPRWSYRLVEEGPSLEFSALGAGREDVPRLLHVGVDWRF